MKVKKITKPELDGDTYLIAQAVNHNAELLEGALNRIKELEKQLEKEEAAGKPIGFEGAIQSEDITNEEAINVLKKFIDAVEEDTVAVSLNSEDVEVLKKAIEVLFHEPFKDAYIKQVVKERDIAVAQLNELGYSLGEKIRPCEKAVSIQDCINAIENTDCELSPQAWEEITNNIMSLPPATPKQEPILSEAKAEIEEQEKWLAEAGYNAYNVGVAFGSIRRALRK